MRVFIFAIFILVGPFAFARWNGDDDGLESHFSFNLYAGEPGCVKLSYINTYGSFPKLKNGTVTAVRFFYSDVDEDSVTENSPFEETMLTTDENDNVAVSPTDFCGFKAGHYVFKYGLYDTNNTLLEFQSPNDWNSYSNSVDVEDPPLTESASRSL